MTVRATTGRRTSIVEVKERRGGRGQTAKGSVQRLFAFFVWYLRVTGLAQFDLGNLDTLSRWRGGVIICNHPCLLDVVLIVSRLPRVFCLMKSGIISNIVLCGTARLAGYVDNHSGTNMVRRCVERLAEGETLLIFPEGTRTRGAVCNPFKLGFALVAERAASPIQTLFIESNCRYLSKGWPFFRAPDTFPLRYFIRMGQRFAPPGPGEAKACGRAIECYYAGTSKQNPEKETVQ